MKLKQLEAALQELEEFRNPNIKLEQYVTRPHLAARIMHTAFNCEDVENKTVCDLGCGSGNLLTAAALLGATHVIGVEIDPEALEICRENTSDLTNVDLILADVTNFTLNQKVDTVVLNPPFGTKNNAGIDMIFLEKAIDIAKSAVYSLHKTVTREHLKRKAKQWGVKMEVVAELKFDLPATYKKHVKKCLDIEVDLICFRVN